MQFKVTVTKEILLDVNENLYEKDVLGQVASYWGLNGYDDEEILEFVAEHIGLHVSNGFNVRELGGVHADENAHRIINSEINIEVERKWEIDCFIKYKN